MKKLKEEFLQDPAAPMWNEFDQNNESLKAKSNRRKHAYEK